MAIIELEAKATVADAEVDELGEQLDRLLTARDAAITALAGASRKLGGLQDLLAASRATEAELRVELEHAQVEAATVHRALTLARTTAEIRGRLLDDIAAAGLWTRGKAIRRAARVQQLLARG